jgi:CubicO group peptidase (beta-lactamase class C family)
MEIYGYCHPSFEPVREAFRSNFEKRLELGASVCLKQYGETLVDLWGGTRDSAKQLLWEKETQTLVFSATKGAAALTAHLLIDRNLLKLDKPIAFYWPAFAQNGKGDILVRFLLDHSAGLPCFRNPVEENKLFSDPGYITHCLELETPCWKPGTMHGYHALTFGWILGELVRRVSGMTLGLFFKKEITDPLKLPFFIGTSEDQDTHFAPIQAPKIIPGKPLSPFQTLFAQPGSLTHLAFTNPKAFANLRIFNEARFRNLELPALNGVSNARGLAGLYEPLSLGGEAGGKRLLSLETVEAMGSLERDGRDCILGIHTRFAQGFMKSVGSTEEGDLWMGPDDSAFGHVGAGGSIGFADPKKGVSFGYAMNQLGSGLLLSERGQSLIRAAYACFSDSLS